MARPGRYHRALGWRISINCSYRPVGVPGGLPVVHRTRWIFVRSWHSSRSWRDLRDVGLPGGGHNAILKVLTDLRQIKQANYTTLALSLAVIVIVVASRKISKKIPGPLIAVTCAIITSWILNLKSYGIQVLGAIPSNLPRIGLPEVAVDWALFKKLVPTAFAIFVVILAQSAATSRAYASRYNERFDENVDLIGLAMANIGAGLSGTFVVNGSPTKTQIVDSAGS